MLTPSPGAEPAYVLNKSFGEHLRSAVSSSLSKYLDRVPDHVYAAVPSKQAADDYAMQQWEVRYSIRFLLLAFICIFIHPPEFYRAADTITLRCRRWTQPCASCWHETSSAT